MSGTLHRSRITGWVGPLGLLMLLLISFAAIPPVFATHDEETVDDFSSRIHYSQCVRDCTGSQWKGGLTGDPAMYQGTQHSSDVYGATASFTFTGDHIIYGYRKIRGGGNAKVFIDGVYRGSVDQRADHKETDATGFFFLDGGPTHTITIRVDRGMVNIDYFAVNCSVVQVPFNCGAS